MKRPLLAAVVFAATLRIPTIAAATPAQDLGRAFRQFDNRQWRTAFNLANSYLAANGRNYSAELIVAGSACMLHPHLKTNAAPFRQLLADYAVPLQQERAVRDWITLCVSPPSRPQPQEAGVSVSGLSVGPNTRVADPNVPMPNLRRPPQSSSPLIARPADACLSGYVWREAFAGDHVCVVPATRSDSAADNAAAASRIDPTGPYGPATCIAGYVWREARAGDTVCVDPERREQAKTDNSQAGQRLAR